MLKNDNNRKAKVINNEKTRKYEKLHFVRVVNNLNV